MKILPFIRYLKTPNPFIRIITLAAALLCQHALATDNSVLSIAVVGPLSGQGAKFGEQQLRAVELAAQHFNASANQDLPTLKVLSFDDGCDPDMAKAAAQAVIKANIQYVIGHLCSGATLAGIKHYVKHNIVVITPGSTNPIITEQGYDKMFRTIGRDDQQGKIAAQYISQVARAQQLAIIDDTQAYGLGLATEVAKNIVSPTKIALRASIDPAQNNFQQLVSELKQLKIDYVYYGGRHKEMGLLIQEARRQQLTAQFMGGDAAASKEINTISRGTANGMLVTLPPDFSREKTNAKLTQQLQKINVDPTSPYTLTSYTAMKILGDSIIAAKSDKASDVVRVLRERQHTTPIGSVEYDHNGDVKDFRFSIFRWNSNGENSLVQF